MKFTNRLVVFATLCVALAHCAAQTPHSPAATSTSLVLSSQAVSTGEAVRLAAAVTSSGTPVSAGLVIFCDATAAYCEGPAVIGSAQLSSAGLAAIKHIFGPGNHGIKALFVGTHAALSSTSFTQSVTVSGLAPSSTSVASTGTAGNYALTATVGYHGLASPAANELADFLDTSNANYLLGTANITGLTNPVYSFTTIPTSPVSTGALPTSVVVDDFNGDGIEDFAAANFEDNTVSVFSGDGHGAFTQLTDSPYAVGKGPDALAILDANADGFPDLVCANSVAGTITFLMGRSGGGFNVGPTVSVGNSPQSITVGDFNSDGYPDLAVANVYDSTVTVLLNDGTGAFTGSNISTYSVGQNPGWVGTADFNVDGNLDLAILNTTSSNITVLEGDGHGGFTSLAGSPFATTAYPVSAALGDFNRDGKTDIAVISGTGNTVSILLNTGTRLAAAGGPYPTRTSPSSVAVSDFNGDGSQDLIVTNGNENDATVLFGDGAGRFSSGTASITELRSPSSVAVADFDGDGTTDLAIANLGGGSVSIRPLQITRSATAKLSSAVIPGAAVAHPVVAKYAGDSLYAASISPSIQLTGSPISTTANISISPSTSVSFGRALQLTASITPPSKSNYISSGSVQFFDGSTQIGQANLSNGQALLSFASLSVATHSLSAKYSGDANFKSSSTPPVNVAVSKATTSITLVTVGGTGASYSYIATVVPSTSGVPTGSVAFFDGTSALGSVTLVSGIATYSVSSLTAGIHTIKATYSGDANYTASSSPQVSASTGDFTISSVKQSNTVLPGKSVAYDLIVTPENSFPNSITFAVTGLPIGAKATFSPATVTPGTVNGSTTMTVTVRAEVADLHRFPTASGIAFALLVLPFAIGRRLRKVGGKFPYLMQLSVMISGSFFVLVAIAGCGSGNGFLGQAPQDYTLVVTATSGKIAHKTTVALNVQ